MTNLRVFVGLLKLTESVASELGLSGLLLKKGALSAPFFVRAEL